MTRHLAFLSLALIASTLASTAEASGLVYAVKGERNTVYLAGSVHMLKQAESQLPPAFERAYTESEALVMEIDLDDLDPAVAVAWMMENGINADGATLRETIGEPLHAKVASAAGELGVPIEGLQQFEPWVITLTLVERAYVKAGFDSESGVEKQLARRAGADKKPITGLETLEQQLGALDTLSAKEQRSFLEQTVAELGNLEEETRDLFAAWRTGDAKRLATLLTDEFREYPVLYRALVTQRNALWMPQIEKLLREKDDYLVVVGALHLVGDDGLLELARARGLKPAPVK
jgi:uncharacterized protein YbaP (TraB family)